MYETKHFLTCQNIIIPEEIAAEAEYAFLNQWMYSKYI